MTTDQLQPVPGTLYTRALRAATAALADLEPPKGDGDAIDPATRARTAVDAVWPLLVQSLEAENTSDAAGRLTHRELSIWQDGHTAGIQDAASRLDVPLDAPLCPHCPDGHTPPTTGNPWAVNLSTRRDGDGQPTHIIVERSGDAHVAESDATWLRTLIRAAEHAVRKEH